MNLVAKKTINKVVSRRHCTSFKKVANTAFPRLQLYASRIEYMVKSKSHGENPVIINKQLR